MYNDEKFIYQQMMKNTLLLKIWWSLIAPKWTTIFNQEYCNKINIVLESLPYEHIILVHWTWNPWHAAVKEYWPKEEWLCKIYYALVDYFRKVDECFPAFLRVEWQRVYQKKISKQRFLEKKLTIVWGTVDIENKKIPSEKILISLMEQLNITTTYILTDVPWVLDLHKNIVIPHIKKNTIVQYKEKTLDMSWGMREKVESIQSCSKWWTWICRIMDGKNINNIKNVFLNNTWIGTQVHF